VTVRAHSVVVSSPPSPIRLGEKATLSAKVYDAHGNVLDRTVTWRSSDARVVSVDASGRIVALAEGWAIITAQADGVESPVEVIVRQQLVPVSAAGRRESRRLALRWLIVLALVAGAVAAGWHFLVR
jgi:Big-like domain-containing protein